MAKKVSKIGVLTSGGDSPGMNVGYKEFDRHLALSVMLRAALMRISIRNVCNMQSEQDVLGHPGEMSDPARIRGC